MRQSVTSTLLALAVAGSATVPRIVRAQELAELPAERGPRFLQASASKVVPVDVNRTPVLARRIRISFTGATLREALDEITGQSGLRLVYGDDVVPLARRVHLRAEGITVAAALTDVLIGTEVDVVFDERGSAALVRRPPPPPTGAVAGRVTDARTGEAVGGAEVLLEDTRWRTLTADDGRFRFAEVAAGDHVLSVRRVGYGRASRPVTVVDGQDATVDVALAPTPTRLEEVVVTSVLTPTEMKAVPTPVSVITADDIERQHVRRYDQLLRQVVPSMLTWEDGTRPDANSISLRGASSFGASPPKIYLDGVEIAQDFYSQIDPASIERIEIIRGPQAAAIYGTDAIGGVMEIFTKRGDPALQRPQVSLQAGLGAIQSEYRDAAALRQEYNGSLRGASGATTFHLGGGYSRDGEWIRNYATERPSLFGGMRFEQGRLGVDVSARYYGQNYHYPFSPLLQATGYPSFQVPSYTRYRAREESYSAQLRYRLLPGWQHQLIVGADRYSYMNETYRPRLRTPSDTFLSLQEISHNQVSVAYRTALTTRLSPELEAVVTAGLDHSLYRFSYLLNGRVTNIDGSIGVAPGSAWLVSRSRMTNTGYFAQAQVGFRDVLFLTGSIRADRNSNFGEEIGTPVSPRVGLSYVHRIGEMSVKLRGAYGEALRAPTPSQKTGAVFGTTVTRENQTLRPERQIGPEVGVDLVVGGRGSLGLTYYRQTARDLIALVSLPPSSDTTYNQNQNVGRVRNEGLEVEGRLDLAGVRLTAQYAYTSSKLLDPGPDYTGYEQVGEQISTIPQHTAGATLTVTPMPRVALTAGMAYVGPRETYDAIAYYRCLANTGPCYDYRSTGSLRAFWTRFGGFAKFNLAVEYLLGRGLTGYLAIENVGNADPAEQRSSSALPGRITTVGVRLEH